MRVAIDHSVAPIRKRAGLSQNAFAAKFGIAPATLKDWEQHRREPEGPAPERTGKLTATLKRTATEFKEDNGTDWAAALTYYSVLSIFPALIAMVSIVGLVGDPKKVTKNLTDIVDKFAPSTTSEMDTS